MPIQQSWPQSALTDVNWRRCSQRPPYTLSGKAFRYEPPGMASAATPDGIFEDPPPPKVHDILLKKARERVGIPCIPNRPAVITRPLNGRPPCHYCGQFGRGCVSASNYSSSQVQILPALKSGRFKIIDLVMAREILIDENAKVEAVAYIDKRTRAERQIRCRALVVAASACESTRIETMGGKVVLLPSRGAVASGILAAVLALGAFLAGVAFFA